VHPVVGLVDQQHVQQIIRVDRFRQVEGAAVDGPALAGGALDEHPAHGLRRHR
jgi:hypothetical protein